MSLSEELFLWRPVLEKVVTYTEVCSVLSLTDVMKINDLLDMKNDLEQESYQRSK